MKKKRAPGATDEATPNPSPNADHVISKPWKESKNARSWMLEQEDDPLFNVSIISVFVVGHSLTAPQDFVWNLKKHALSQLLDQGEEPTREDINNTDIGRDGKISIHKTLRVNYTTYDLQRRSDIINLRTRPDVMIASPKGDRTHPYRYGRLIDVFTVPIHYRGPKQVTGGLRRKEIQVLWVRWFQLNSTYKDGFPRRRLPQLEFVEPHNTTEWHGFISPSEVLRAVHTIPAFNYDLMDPQPCREESHAVRFLRDDWNYYYVNV